MFPPPKKPPAAPGQGFDPMAAMMGMGGPTGMPPPQDPMGGMGGMDPAMMGGPPPPMAPSYPTGDNGLPPGGMFDPEGMGETDAGSSPLLAAIMAASQGGGGMDPGMDPSMGGMMGGGMDMGIGGDMMGVGMGADPYTLPPGGPGVALEDPMAQQGSGGDLSSLLAMLALSQGGVMNSMQGSPGSSGVPIQPNNKGFALGVGGMGGGY